MRNLKILLFLVVLASVFNSCKEDNIENIMDNNTNQEVVNDQLEELQLMMDEGVSKIGLCAYESVLDENGCCVYNLPYKNGFWYTLDGQFFSGGRVVVCPEESVSLARYERFPENPSGLAKRCIQQLTCSCCDKFELGYTAEYLEEDSEFPGCCRFTLNFNNPDCTGTDLVLRGIIPTLGLNAYKPAAPLELNSVIICGPMNGTTLDLVAGVPNLGCIKRETVSVDYCH